MRSLWRLQFARAAQVRIPHTPSRSLAAQKSRPFDTTGRASGFARRTTRSSPPSRAAGPTQDGAHGGLAAPPSSISTALANSASSNTAQLLAPVHVPPDPNSVLPSDHPATSLLANSSIVIHRQLEMMNVFLGFEQANKYVINDAHGNVIGFLAEQEHGLGNAIARQTFRTHRSFTTHVFDSNERELLRLHRPFSWINSKIRVYDAVNERTGGLSGSDALTGTSASSLTGQGGAQISTLPVQDMRVIGEAQQAWAPLRRKYNLFLHRNLDQIAADREAPQLTAGDLPLSSEKAIEVADAANENLGFAQFAYVDEPFLSWDFSLKSEDQRLVGSVNRNFAGFAREIFTDTGVYALRMDSAGLSAEPHHIISQSARTAEPSTASGMTLDQRAVMLATAVSIDFDYFSRTRGGVVDGFMPLWFPYPMGGGAAGEAGAEGAAGTAVGEAGEAGEVGRAGDAPAAGAGGMAGYGAMQQGQPGDGQSPQAPEPSWGLPPNQQEQQSSWDEVWGEERSNQGGWGGGDGGDGGGEGGGNFFDDWL